MVNRVNATNISVDTNGNYVSYVDYRQLEITNTALLEQINVLNQKLILCGCDGFGYGQVYGGFYGD
jgi:hypothetical protein